MRTDFRGKNWQQIEELLKQALWIEQRNMHNLSQAIAKAFSGS